jgi:enamine deaminase RidA (YjgF/YER057c/UK114 family)
MTVRCGRLLFVAGHAPLWDGQYQFVGKVGREWTLEQGRAAARLTALNMLATLRATLGDLDQVRRVVKLLGLVNCTEEFTRLPEVIDAASDLFVALWGERGQHARSTVGAQQLHFGMAIEHRRHLRGGERRVVRGHPHTLVVTGPPRR